MSDAERALYPSDSEPPVEHVRDVLVVRRIFNGRVVSVSALGGEPDIRADDLSAEWAEFYCERSAIREYCGNQSRKHAETEAMKETIGAMLAAEE